ncbi:uncharacterized protein LOC132460027 [Gadus macrocephalus]|uniref:uncharacterized protein LOC132460027 n=1 Tax=Gadus macrocephalus TaxID=80720 RepID=UPI0028CBBD7E|nr:uncharacterized protein LOC132460027 [Gadus macrocephalus]
MPALLPHMGLSYPVSIEIWMTPQDLEPSPYIMRRRGTGEDKVASPYISGLIHHLECSFENLNLLGAFSVLGPQATSQSDEQNNAHLKILANKFLPENEINVIQEYQSFREHIHRGQFKDKSQADILRLLASECDEWGLIYPLLSRLAAIALVVPVSSVNCERDFSTMNRVKTDLRNRLQGEHLAACLRISINGPEPEDLNYQRALELFFSKPRKMKCSSAGCHICK